MFFYWYYLIAAGLKVLLYCACGIVLFIVGITMILEIFMALLGLLTHIHK